MENQNEKISPKHVFLHLFTTAMLYVTVINILTFVFQYVNLYIKDPLVSDFFSNNYSYGLIRYSLASIIIVFPLFIWGSWFLNKIYLKTPEIRQMKTRKWIIYFTLFVIALIIVGDLVRTLLSFLNGEITLRFILKALSVLIVTGSIFGYYLWDVRRETLSKLSKYFAFGVTAIILILVVSGFILAGSPQKERLARFDQQKVSDLQGIQSQIIYYWQSKERLPQNLGDLDDTISGYKAPEDSQANKPYEYTVKGENAFELCAEFNLPIASQQIEIIEPMPFSGKGTSNWGHNAGRVCFERKIDKELYPPLNKVIK